MIKTFNITCAECGGPGHGTSRNYAQRFCSTACRKEWQNRRAVRGAELYDMFMTMRFDRANAKGVYAVMCRMASEWNEQDKAAGLTAETGRRSFSPVKEMMQRHIKYVATKHVTKTGRKRSG